MYACNVYDVTQEFEDSIAAETADNAKRLRHHASLGLWCGNNEIESAWAYWGNYQTQSQYLRADYIKQFEYILPKALKRQTTRPFSGLLLLHQVDALMNRELRTVEIPITGKYGMGRSHFLIIRSISSDSARSLGSSLFHQKRQYIPIQNRRIGISSHRLWRAIRRMMLPMAKCCTICQRTSAILRILKVCYT